MIFETPSGFEKSGKVDAFGLGLAKRPPKTAKNGYFTKILFQFRDFMSFYVLLIQLEDKFVAGV